MNSNTLPETESPESKATANGWAAITSSLRSRFPKATEGILFCVYKLEQDPSLTIPDFRQEAALHGIKLGGRALHSAKVLLGLAEATEPRKASTKTAGRAAKTNGTAGRRSKSNPKSLEDQVMHAITLIQDSATDQTRRLRDAIKEAVRILEDALDE